MEQVSKNSTGGAAGARGACGWDPPAGRSRAAAGRPLPPAPPRAPGAAFSLLPGCCPLRRNKGNKGTLCPQHPGSVVRGDRGPQHWARTACPCRRRLGRRAEGRRAQRALCSSASTPSTPSTPSTASTAAGRPSASRPAPPGGGRRGPVSLVLGAGSGGARRGVKRASARPGLRFWSPHPAEFPALGVCRKNPAGSHDTAVCVCFRCYQRNKREE